MCKDRGALHQRIRKTFGFPDYYGENWDAMWDCLTDVFLQPVQRHIVVEGFAAMPQELREYAADYRHNKTCGQSQVNELRFSNIFAEKRSSSYLQSLGLSRLFSFTD